MASLDDLRSNHLNLKNKITKREHKKNIMWPIKNFEKYSTAFQYTPKIFHEPHNNPVAPPPTYLMYCLLYVFWL